MERQKKSLEGLIKEGVPIKRKKPSRKYLFSVDLNDMSDYLEKYTRSVPPIRGLFIAQVCNKCAIIPENVQIEGKIMRNNRNRPVAKNP